MADSSSRATHGQHAASITRGASPFVCFNSWTVGVSCYFRCLARTILSDRARVSGLEGCDCDSSFRVVAQNFSFVLLVIARQLCINHAITSPEPTISHPAA